MNFGRITPTEGMNHIPGGIAFFRNGRAQYGFRVKPKGIPEEQRKTEIAAILKATDDFAKENKLCERCEGNGKYYSGVTLSRSFKCPYCGGKGFVKC